MKWHKNIIDKADFFLKVLVLSIIYAHKMKIISQPTGRLHFLHPLLVGHTAMPNWELVFTLF